MKYMTFNSSCSFAGVANMLLQLGINVEDRQIAMGIKLPYLFDLQDGVFSAGPMLQSARWFDLYLNTLGYAMKETAVRKPNVPNYLRQCGVAMLGLRVSSSEKHAVIFVGMEEENFRFINNKWQGSGMPEKMCLSEKTMAERLDDTVMVATIEKVPVSTPDTRSLLLRSCQVLEQYKTDIATFCSIEKTREELIAAMNPLFRATLLDGITMLELIGQTGLAEQFKQIQKPFLSAIRKGQPVVLREILDLQAWQTAIDQYIALIKNE